MENLKHAQPHSSEGHQDQQGDHQEADAAPFPGALWLSPPVRYRWWEGSNRGCRRAGGTGVGTAVHPKYLWVHVVQVLLHGWEWDGLDVLCVIFHVAAKNCRGWPRLSPGGRPSSAFICLHHSSSEHPAQMLQNSMKASSRNSKPPKASALVCKFGASACSSHTAAAHTHSGTKPVADGARTTEASGSRCSQRSASSTPEGCAGSQGLSNQPSTHPPASHPFQQPTQAEAVAFPLRCPAPQAEGTKTLLLLAPCTRGRAEDDPLGRRMKI